MASHFRLTLKTTKATAPIIALLRRHTGKSMSDLRNAITTQQPFLDATPDQNDYEEFATSVVALLDNLEAEDIQYLVEVDGSPESLQHLRNIFQQGHEIDEQTRHEMDLESGEPCIETLEWLKRESPHNVFCQTLKQIVKGRGYKVDAETLAWAKRELDID